MCLAIPSRIVSIEGHTAIIDVDGVRRKASLLLLDDAQVGEFVIVHAGFAIHKIDETVAMESLSLLRESLAAVETLGLSDTAGLTLNREIDRTE